MSRISSLCFLAILSTFGCAVSEIAEREQDFEDTADAEPSRGNVDEATNDSSIDLPPRPRPEREEGDTDTETTTEFVPDSIDMRVYYPTAFQEHAFRRPDGSLFKIVRTKPEDSILHFHGAQPPGSKNFSKEYYYTREHRVPAFDGDDPPACFTTARSFRNGRDGHVLELGGSPLHFLDTTCHTSWTRSGVTTYRTQDGKETGLYWGRPGANLREEPFFGRYNLQVWYTPDQSLPIQHIGDAFSTHGLVEYLPTFQPEYGRNSDGEWCEGCGPTYDNVVHVRFIHGTDYPQFPERVGPTACPNQPYPHIDGYNSYWLETWLAPGLGAVQNKTMFMEDVGHVVCNGASVSSNPNHFRSYIDNPPKE